MRNKTNGIGFAHNLYRLIEHCDENAKEVANWSEEGTEIIIRDPSELEKTFLPLFFEKQPKFTSFVKQLNNYGFTKTNRGKSGVGPTKAEIFYHENFRRGATSLLDKITLNSRRKASKTTPAGNPNEEKLLQVIDERIKVALLDHRPSYFTELEEEVLRLRQQVARLSQIIESLSLGDMKVLPKNPPLPSVSMAKNCEEPTAYVAKQGHDQINDGHHYLPEPPLLPLKVDHNDKQVPCSKAEKIKHANSDETVKTMHSNVGFHFATSKHPIADTPPNKIADMEKRRSGEQQIHPQQHSNEAPKSNASIATMSTISLDTTGPPSAKMKKDKKAHSHEYCGTDYMSTTEPIDDCMVESRAVNSMGSDVSLHSWLQAQKFHPVDNQMKLDEMSNVTYDLSSFGIIENADQNDKHSR